MKRMLPFLLFLLFVPSASEATSYNFLCFFDSRSAIGTKDCQAVVDEFARHYKRAVESSRGGFFRAPIVLVEGHSDQTEPGSQSLILSRERAVAVRDMLVKAGIPENTIAYRWWGSAQPLVPHDGKIENAQNRYARIQMQ